MRIFRFALGSIWVLPVLGIPVPDMRSRQIFDRLDPVTAPPFRFLQPATCDGTISVAVEWWVRRRVLAVGSNREAMEELMAEDPFCSRGLATFRVFEFRASQRRHLLTVGALRGVLLGLRGWFVAACSFGILLGCDRDPVAGSQAAPSVLSALTMTDQDGRVLAADALEGNLLVLNFMFSSCRGPCPRITRLIANTRKLLPEDTREQIRFLSITVDPENDTPFVLKALAQEYSADEPSWRFVSVSPRELDLLAGRLTVFDPKAPKAPPAHSTKLYLFDRRGRALQRYDGSVVDPSHLARELVAVERLDRED